MIRGCIRQIFRPNPETKVRVEGVGDCQICTYDEHNKNCRMFHEVCFATVQEYEDSGIMGEPTDV